MSWAMVGSAAVSVIGGMMAQGSASDAASEGAAATREAAAMQMGMFRQMRNTLRPWVGAGENALSRLMYLTGLDESWGANRRAGTTGAGPRTWQNFFDEASARAPRLPGDPSNAAGHWGPQPGYGDVGTAPHVWLPGPGAGGDGGPDTAWARTEADRLWAEHQAGMRDAAQDPEFGSLLRAFSLDDFEEDPGYQFRREEGERALTRGQLARGIHASTPGLRELMRFNQGLASQEYGAAWTRDAAERARTFDYLQAFSLGGLNAGTQTGVAGINAGATSSALTAQAGQITAQGGLAGAGALSSSINAGMGNFMYQRRFDQQMGLQRDFLRSLSGGGTLNLSNWSPSGNFGGADWGGVGAQPY